MAEGYSQSRNITAMLEDLHLDDKQEAERYERQHVSQHIAERQKYDAREQRFHRGPARQSAGSRQRQWQPDRFYQRSQHSHTKHHQRQPRQCARHKLLGRCHIGAGCDFLHSGQPMSNPPTDYIPVSRGVTIGALKSFLGKVELSSERKFFIPVLSDRKQHEIKVVAEDYTTLKQAKRMVFKKLEAASPRGRRGRECVKYKLLGNCDNEQCKYVHREICNSPSVGYVAHPQGSAADVRKAVGIIGRFANGVYLTTISDKDKDQEIKIIAENKETLQLAMKEILQRLESAVCKIATTLKFCFVHPDGVESQSLLQLHVHGDSEKGKEVFIEQIKGSVKADTLRVEDFSRLLLSRDLPHSVDYILNSPERITALVSPSVQVRLLRGYREQIHKHLGASLKWLCGQNVHLKLEGRFGKLQWTGLPMSFQKRPVSIKDFVEFISSHEHRRSFSTRLQKASTVQAVERLRDLDSTVESYDIKMGKLDIRLQVVGGRLEVMAVKKDEIKVLLADILCLHRTNDMRLSLGCFQTVANDDQDVQKVFEGIHLSANGELTLTPKSGKWSAESVRHKTRRAYLYGKKNYLVTVSCVETYKIRADRSKQATITLAQKDWEKHYEVEVHNLDWEVSFGHVNGHTPQQSLCLFLEPDKIPSELLIPTQHEWNSDSIMADFIGDGFLQMMDDINRSMDSHQNTE